MPSRCRSIATARRGRSTRRRAPTSRAARAARPAMPIAAGYLQRLPAAAAINEAMIAYADNKTADAYKLYHEARGLAAPDDLRVLNGLYTTSWKTGRKKEAAETFGKIVGVGLDAKRLPIKMFFTPGTTTLLQTATCRRSTRSGCARSRPQAAARDTCLRVVGHTSRTGDAPPTTCSRRSAPRSSSSASSARTGSSRRASSADGVGSREILVGLGTDDRATRSTAASSSASSTAAERRPRRSQRRTLRCPQPAPARARIGLRRRVLGVLALVAGCASSPPRRQWYGRAHPVGARRGCASIRAARTAPAPIRRPTWRACPMPSRASRRSGPAARTSRTRRSAASTCRPSPTRRSSSAAWRPGTAASSTASARRAARSTTCTR